MQKDLENNLTHQHGETKAAITLPQPQNPAQLSQGQANTESHKQERVEAAEEDNKQKAKQPVQQKIEVPEKNVPSDQAKKKAEERKKILVKLFRAKRQKEADDELEEYVAKDEQLISAFRHNKFGAFCLQAGDLKRAEEHLEKARDEIEKHWVFSNVHMNLGNLWAQKKNYLKAIEEYDRVLELSPHRDPREFLGKDQILFSKQLNSFHAYVDAHTNLAVMYVQLDQFQKGFEYCKKSLELKPDDSESLINFTDILRQLGKKNEAIAHSWSQIVQYTRLHGRPDYEAPVPLNIKPYLPKGYHLNGEKAKQNQGQTKVEDSVEMETKQQHQVEKTISVLTVKWGVRYNADYVNKLYAGIRRNTTWKITFYCFTDDPSGLHEDIKTEKLQEGWKRWWGKVTLFNCQIPGRKFYIDLDMIITGPLDALFAYQGQFATLRTGDLACEKNHKDGYNSSVMIWSGENMAPIYHTLRDNFDAVTKFIVRFDFWLQMTIANADYVQVLYPGIVVDFLADAKEQLPPTASVVCFARKPKPEDYPAPWVAQYWTL